MSHTKTGGLTLNKNAKENKVYIDRLKTNEGLYPKLVQNIKYVVISKGGSYIPCVSVDKFSLVSADLPDQLKKIRFVQAHTLTSKLDDNAWRLSHGNDMDFLPEFNITNKVFANERDNFRSTESHKMQQFQEYDVSKLVKKVSSKEVDDLGAMRVIVDECFQHVYFTIEHYRPTVEGKITVSQKSGAQDIEAVNPYIFILFEPPPLEKKTNSETNSGKKNKPASSPTDLLFEDTNITEVKEFGKPKTTTFKGFPVTVIYPGAQKRGRSNSFMQELQRLERQRDLEWEIAEAKRLLPTPLEKLAMAHGLPKGGVEQAAMTLGLSPVNAPDAEGWNRIKLYVQVHYGVVAR